MVSYAYDDGQLITITGRGGSVHRRFQWHNGLMSAHEDADGLLSEYRWREINGQPRVVAYRHSGGRAAGFLLRF